MRLGTDPINELRPTAVDLLDEIHDGLQLCVRAVQVEVVDVQLGGRVCGASGLEGGRDELFAEDVEEHRRTEGAVLVEDLVHDIPRADLAGVASSNVLNVVLDDGGQSGSVADGRNPAGELRVPDYGMKRSSKRDRLGDL